jgi:hypothetical protein
MMIRAKNEFEGALGGLLLTIAAHAWVIQFAAGGTMRLLAGLNPFAVFMVLTQPQYLGWLPLMLAVQLVLWIVLPVFIMFWWGRRRSHA